MGLHKSEVNSDGSSELGGDLSVIDFAPYFGRVLQFAANPSLALSLWTTIPIKLT